MSLLAILALAGCMGGSDGIENPKVELDFHGPDGTLSGTGEVRVYARNLNPAVDDKPLLTRTFSGDARFRMDSDDMDSVLRARGNGAALKDTVVEFNVVAVSGDREALVSGFRYRRSGGKPAFAQAPWDGPHPEYGDVKRSADLLAAVLDFKGVLGSNGMSFGIDYVYIPGSPYFANVKPEAGTTRGEFQIARMSRGSYGLLGADKDSAAYFQSADTLNTSDTAYTAGAWDPITIIDR